MAFAVTNVLLGAIGLLLILYYYVTKNFDYWKKRKVPGPTPSAFFGNFKEVLLGKTSMPERLKSIYHAYPNETIVGLFMMGKPIVLIRDLDLLKDVMIKNFNSFADRGVRINEKLDPLSQHLVFLDPKRWKPLRKKLTPAFTSGKLKDMFYLVHDCAEQFKDYLRIMAERDETFDCREVTAKYTTDVIGVCAFGLNMDALSNEDSQFRNYGRQRFAMSWRNTIRREARLLPQWLSNLIAPFVCDDELVNFFLNIVKDTIEYRKKNNVKKGDFIDILIELKDHPETVAEDKMDDLFLTAQAFVFFVAGFETSSTTMSHALYELALNPDIQDTLREEINLTLEQNNGKITYDAVKNMPYLDKVFKETLRKYPAAPDLSRKATSDYTYEKIFIPKGMLAMIPVYSIHHDPSIYPNPEKFDPERFDEEVVKTRHPMSYIPFGEGPRICIGERFAKIQSKMGLISMLKNLKFEVCDKTDVHYKILPHSPILTPRNGIHLKAIVI